MSTLEIKQELKHFIEKSDDNSILKFYAIVKKYMEQIKKDKMIAEGEQDIENGDVFTSNEIKEYIKNWKA